jgi:hypothetical protein
MADCELIPKCPFFNGKMREMPAIVVMYKESYCKTDNSQCARYMVITALGKEKVAATLYPNMTHTAETIIAEHR